MAPPPSTQVNVRVWTHLQVGDTEASEIRYAKTGSEGEVQHCPVADPTSRGRSGSIQESVEFATVEVGHTCLVSLLGRDDEESWDLIGGR